MNRSIEEHLKMNIKTLIKEFPPLVRVLDEFGIGCGPCTVGTCLLGDIVKIHNLSPDDERKLFARIEDVLSGRAAPEPPHRQLEARPQKKKIAYSPPVQKLVDEHVFIKKLVFSIPRIAEHLTLESEEDRDLVRQIVDFIRSYADKYHHAKEEQILFRYFDANLEILTTMKAQHELGRGYVRAILDALERGDAAQVAVDLLSYHELLKEHIRKEDEILYPWMDRNLSMREVGEVFSKFNDVETEFGEAPRRYETFVGALERKMLKEEVRQ